MKSIVVTSSTVNMPRDVYPFAVEAIQTYETIQEVTTDLSVWKNGNMPDECRNS